MTTDAHDLAFKAITTALDELEGRSGRDNWAGCEPQHMSAGYMTAARTAAAQLSDRLEVPTIAIGHYLRKHFLLLTPDHTDPIAEAARTAVIEVIADRVVLDYDSARDPLLIEGRRRLLVHITAELAREWNLTPHDTAQRLLHELPRSQRAIPEVR